MWTRKPDLIIGDPPQTLRWHLFRWRGLQVSLHKWVRSDSDRALHDHSADNISILLNDVYREWFFDPMSDPRWHKDVPFPAQVPKVRFPLIPYYRRAETPHRVELLTDTPVWTIWIRFKPRRSWGFWCGNGWRHWRDYVDQRDSGKVGRGCD